MTRSVMQLILVIFFVSLNFSANGHEYLHFDKEISCAQFKSLWAYFPFIWPDRDDCKPAEEGEPVLSPVEAGWARAATEKPPPSTVTVNVQKFLVPPAAPDCDNAADAVDCTFCQDVCPEKCANECKVSVNASSSQPRRFKRSVPFESTLSPERNVTDDTEPAFNTTSTDPVILLLNSVDNETSDDSSQPQFKIRQCFCSEVFECKKESHAELHSCFDSCDEGLAVFGNNTHSYMDCFELNASGLSQAEECLEDKLGEYCASGNESTYIDNVDTEMYFRSKFIMNKAPRPINSIRYKTHVALAGFQQFYHCAKQCVHKRMSQCFRSKGSLLNA